MQIREYIPYYKRNLNVALPVMITQAGQVLVQLADNIMVGQLGAAQLAGISFANAILVIGVVFAIGFSQGITPIVGQYFGRNEHHQVSKNLCNSIVLNLILMIFTTIVMFGVGAKLHLFGQDPEVLEYARGYYYILTASFIPMIVFNGIRFFSEGIGNTKYAMWITISTNILNIFLNWVLIYGKLGAEAMGVDGAAWATLIARIVAAILFVAFMFIAKEYRHYTLSIKLKDLNFKTIREQLRLSIPISIQSTLEVTSFSIAAIMVGWFGKYELAAHQIAQSLSTFTFMIATGIGAAATIRVSHQYGAGNYKETAMAGKASVHMAIAFMTLCGAIFILLREILPYAFTQDPNVACIAEDLIIVLALFQIFDATQLTSLSSLRGLKDIKLPLLFSFISYYLICLPIAYLLGFTLEMGPLGVWIGLAIGLAAAAITFYIRFIYLCKRMPISDR
ncbi:MAG: MATE family efflux transporter [Bacteroidales bacterium]|nr:MATE family efflux transporter [Bacteroidales bacterium]